jgi:ABC-type branched-subunit amino acid transport system ATPase component
MLRAVAATRREFSVTVVLIEESLGCLSGWVDKAYVLDRGVLIDQGPIDVLAQSAPVASAYLGEIWQRGIT